MVGEIKFPDARLKGKCCFCNGNLSEGKCIMCGRSTNVRHELYVIGQSKLPHANWNTNQSESERLSRAGKSNPDGYGRRKKE